MENIISECNSCDKNNECIEISKKIEYYEILDLIENLPDHEKFTLLSNLADKYCFNCLHNKYGCICVPGY